MDFLLVFLHSFWFAMAVQEQEKTGATAAPVSERFIMVEAPLRIAETGGRLRG